MIQKSQAGASAEPTAGAALAEFTAKRRGPVRRFFYHRPVVMDIVVVLIYWLISFPNVIWAGDVVSRWSLVLVFASGIVLFFRRRFPVPVLVVAAALDILLVFSDRSENSNAGAAAMFALYAVAVARGGRYGFSAAAVVTLPVAVLVFFSFWTKSPVPNISGGQLLALAIAGTGMTVLLNVIATGIGVSVWRDRRHEMELREWAERNADFASANERNRIAREMHDVVAHSLSVMIALSDGAQVVLTRSPEKADEALTKLSQTGRGALSDMQRVLGVLRLEGSAEQGNRRPLPADFDVESLLAGFRAAGMPLSFSVSGPALPEDPAFQLTVYRIVQESLTNVLRYARSVSRVEVKIDHHHPEVWLSISDDGRGYPAKGMPSMGSGKGLIGMRERAAAYGGEVSAGQGASGGWHVDARLQCPDSATVQEKS